MAIWLSPVSKQKSLPVLVVLGYLFSGFCVLKRDLGGHRVFSSILSASDSKPQATNVGLSSPTGLLCVRVCLKAGRKETHRHRHHLV